MNRRAISDRYEYTNEKSINERLKCIICCNPFIDPVKTKCKPREHTFCRHCITEWLQSNSSCPSCRQNIEIQELIPITEGILLDMLNELEVDCSVCKKSGIERGNVDEHVKKQCSNRNILCSSADIECPWTGSDQELGEHLKTCPYTALRSMLIQLMTDKKQLEERVNQQQILIDKLQNANPQFKEQPEQQKRPMPTLSTGIRPTPQPKKPIANSRSAMSPMSNKQRSSPRASCNNCPDCWPGAVRGSFFRGEAGGGFKPGTTLLACDCDCHP